MMVRLSLVLVEDSTLFDLHTTGLAVLDEPPGVTADSGPPGNFQDQQVGLQPPMMSSCCPLMEVLYRLLDQDLGNDKLDLQFVAFLLDLPIQHALVFPHFDPVGWLSGGRDGKSLERVILSLGTGELLSGEA